jgi:glycosyltransferase involved in cell wall biosynthesis
MSQSLVSVVIPAFNSKKYIAETLQSVSNQSYKNFEVVIVDDGSTDGQSEIIQQHCAADARFRAIFQENTGVSTARNNGFNHTKGKYIAFLDADDVWLPDNLQLKIDKLEAGPYGLVHSNCQVIDHHSNPVAGERMTGNEGMLLREILKWERTQIPGPSSILVLIYLGRS